MTQTNLNSTSEPPFVVAICSSAGGFKALETFLPTLNHTSNVCYVLIGHMDPKHDSYWQDLLQKYTPMPMGEIQMGMQPEAGTLYVLPKNSSLTMLNGCFHLLAYRRNPIDQFLQSLAVDQKDRCIAVILSGGGSDGSLGLKAIKEEGGLVLVQSPDTCEVDSMPRNAIATELADSTLPLEKLAQPIEEWVRLKAKLLADPEGESSPERLGSAEEFQRLLLILRAHSGHDFTQYKKNTLRRRIERRLIIHQLETLADYIRLLENDPPERERLLKELLIGVTSFFRDAEAFETLSNRVVPYITQNVSPGKPLRIWVPGCSTGEEAYSIAMTLLETFQNTPWDFDLRIFASDIDKDSLEFAREGRYPKSITAEVTEERLQRFFIEEREHYRIKKELKDKVIFALQDVTRDPPFSKVDAISCRNLMIYLEAPLQQKLLRIFHYSLNPSGILFMGSSETVGDSSELFSAFDKRWKFFERTNVIASPYRYMDFEVRSFIGTPIEPKISPRPSPLPRKPALREVAQEILIDAFAPPSILCDEIGDILFIHGRTGSYLEPASGEARMNIFAMVREGLKLEVSRGIQRVFDTNQMVQYVGLVVRRENGSIHVDLTVRPLANFPYHRRLALITFETRESSEPLPEKIVVDHDNETDRRIVELERELLFTREHMQTLVEQLETSNEELKSMNEELQSSNEELQSSNEELETAKEELQAVNEELLTLNTELQAKIEELSTANNDLDNFLSSSSIATIFLDRRFLITRFSRSTTKIFRLIPSDVGRSIGDIASQLKYDSILNDAEEVLNNLVIYERVIETKEGRSLFMRITPYKTSMNVIDGVVVGFLDVTEQSRLEGLASELKQAFRHVTQPILLVSGDGVIVQLSRSAAELIGEPADEIVGKPCKRAGIRILSPDGRNLLSEAEAAPQGWEGTIEIVHRFRGASDIQVKIVPIIHNSKLYLINFK